MRFHALGVPRNHSQHQFRLSLKIKVYKARVNTGNLKLALETMTSGIGPINMDQLLSFLDLSNCKTLNARFFKNMELTISSTLRKVALESMEEATKDEVRLTIHN